MHLKDKMSFKIKMFDKISNRPTFSHFYQNLLYHLDLKLLVHYFEVHSEYFFIIVYIKHFINSFEESYDFDVPELPRFLIKFQKIIC